MNIEKTQYTQMFFEQYRMNITDSGYAEVNGEWACGHVCSPFSRLYYVTEGTGEIWTQDRHFKLLAEHVYLIPLGTVYRSDCRDHLNHLYFHFNIDTPNGYDLLRGMECAGISYPRSKTERLTALYQSGTLLDQMELQQELIATMIRLLKKQTCPPEFQATYSDEVLRTIEYLREHLSAQLTVEKIADALFLSKNSLFKQFRREVGLPIGKYIDKLIFFRAEQLLTKSNLSVKEISESLGFCDQFYFSRRFLQYFEERPLAYRNRTRKINQI